MSPPFVQVVYNPEIVDFYEILKTFWECHDPTQGNRQGNDSGTQYRSGIYCSEAEQLQMAMKTAAMYSKALTASGRNGKITTEIAGPPNVSWCFDSPPVLQTCSRWARVR